MPIAFLLPLFVSFQSPLVADQSSVDRGNIRVGPPLTQEFRLSNQSDQVVTITGVASTCGCLSPKLDRTKLLPRECATISVEVNTLSQPAGRVSWGTSVHWKTSDASGTIPLTLQAELIAEVRVEPTSVAFQVRRSRSIDLTVTDFRPKPFRITAVGTTLPQLAAELLPASHNSPQRIRLTANADGPTGVQSAVAWFTTDDPQYPQIRVPVTLNSPAKTRVTASPSALLLEGLTGRILLRDSEGQPVQVDRVETVGPYAATVSGAVVTVSMTKANGVLPSPGKVIVHVVKPVIETISISVDVR